MILATILMALREIRRNGTRSFLTALGIIIGVASVIAMVTLGRSASDKISADIAGMGTNLLIVMPGAERRGPVSATAAAFRVDDARAITREVRAVAAVAPTLSRSGLAVSGNRNWSTQITGTTNAYFSVCGYTFAAGVGFSDAEILAGMPVCVLGETVRRELFGRETALGASLRVGSVACTVVGVLESKGKSTLGFDQDDFVAMPLATVQRRVVGDVDVGAMFVSAVSDGATGRAKQQIEALMRERRHILPGRADDFSVQDMKELAKTFGSITAALTALLGAIAGVSLLVGGIGIMNIMLVSVTERTREIGVRLAIGALGSEVMLQFLIEAVTLSMLGGALGVVLGVGGSFAAARGLGLPFSFSPDILLIAFGFSATVGVGFGFFPARKAARLNPIEALRSE